MYAFMYIDMLCTKLNLLSSPDVTDAWGKVYSLLTKPQTVPSWIVPVISHLLSQMSLNIALLFRRTSQSELMFCGFFFSLHIQALLLIYESAMKAMKGLFSQRKFFPEKIPLTHPLLCWFVVPSVCWHNNGYVWVIESWHCLSWKGPVKVIYAMNRSLVAPSPTAQGVRSSLGRSERDTHSLSASNIIFVTGSGVALLEMLVHIIAIGTMVLRKQNRVLGSWGTEKESKPE